MREGMIDIINDKLLLTHNDHYLQIPKICGRMSDIVTIFFLKFFLVV
jgi:hypothetical protein